MKRFYLLLLTLFTIGLIDLHAQSNVFNPADPDNVFTPTNHPSLPPNGSIAKWGHIQSLTTWGGTGTTSYKAYYYNGMAFRLKFPKTYQHNVADGKKFPLLIFFHGAGEGGDAYDNEYQMYHGGDVFRNWVDNGDFDGFVFFEQSSGFHENYFGYVTNMIDSLVRYCKVDPDRVIVNGLSSGGMASWEIEEAYPKYFAAAIPLSAAMYSYVAPMPDIIHIPNWLFNGGQDVNPNPYIAQVVVDSFVNKGGNIKHTFYPQLGHNTWDAAWTDPGFVPFLNWAHKANPLVYYGRTEFCPGDVISVKMGLTPGFYAYEWQKDGVTIAGANSNILTVNQLGTYRARFKRTATSAFSDWSPTPIVVKYHALTITPPIKVNGLHSNVLPAPDNSTTVPLILPDGYTSYKWVHLPDSAVLGSQQIFNAHEGQYVAKVTELYGCVSTYSPVYTVVSATGANPPDAATNLTATAVSKTAITLSWNQNNNPTYNETGFEIYRAVKAGGPYELIAINPTDNINYLDQGLTASTAYFYIVRPVNNNGAAPLSKEATASTQADLIAPTTPTNLQVYETNRSFISLKWNASTDDMGVAQYDIYVNGRKAYSTTSTSFTVNNLTFKQTYSFSVRARDAAGNQSPFSNQVSAIAALVGLRYSYYEGTWQSLPDYNLLTPVKTGITNNVDISVRQNELAYSILWQGFINIPADGDYTFETKSDDGSRFYIGHYVDNYTPPLVANDGTHGIVSATGTITLHKGIYPVAISYFQNSSQQSMELYWSSTSGIARQRVPDIAFTDDLSGVNPDNVSGLSYSYYEGTWNSAPDFTVLNPVKQGSSPNIDLAVRSRDDNYGIVWKGYITIPADGSYTFETKSDDGSKLYIGYYNNTAFPLINNDGLHAAESVTGTIYLTAGRYPITAVFFQNGGGQLMELYWSSTTGITRQKIPDNAFGANAVVNNQSGLNFSYYEGTWNALPDFTTLTPVKQGSSANIDLGVRNRDVNYGVVWQGFITIPTDGTYTFETNSDDGSRVYLGSYGSSTTPLVNNDGLHAAQIVTGAKFLTAGRYPIAITFFQNSGGQTMELYWSSNTGITRQKIPDNAFGANAVVNNQSGLNFSYYEGTWNALPDFTTLTPVKQGSSANIDLGVRNRDVNYGVVWQGFITIPADGTYTFETNSDDGSRVYLGTYGSSTTPLVDNDGLHAAQIVTGAKFLTAGRYPIAITFFQNSGGQTMELYWSSNTGITRQKIPDNAFVSNAVVNSQSGLNFSYYEGTWNALPDFTTLTPVKQGSSANIDLGVRNRDINYGLVWQGYINIPADGTYTFETNSDDGSKLYIGTYNSSASPLINNDGPHGPQVVTGAKFFAAGRYPIAITFFQNGGGQTMELYWSSNNGIGRQKVPDNAFAANTSVSNQSGLNYSYYEGTWNNLPDFNTLTPVKKGVSNNIDLGVRNKDLNYGILWQGFINITKGGNYTFETNSDDGSKLYLGAYDNSATPLISNDGIHAPNVVTGTTFLSPGIYPIAVSFFQNSGGQTMELYWSSSANGIARQKIPDSVFLSSVPPLATNQSLNYSYYEGTWNSLPDFNTLTPVKKGTSANIDLGVRNRDLNYGIVWQGYINVPKPGNYTFETTSDDGSRVYMGTYNNASTPLINNDGLHGPQNVTGKVFLNAGLNPISVVFFQATGGQTMELYWSSDVGLARQRIPDDAFAGTGTASAISTSSVYVNFGTDTVLAPQPWNNVVGKLAAGQLTPNLKDEKGNNSGITLTFLDTWAIASEAGMKANNTAIFPDAVLKSAIYEPTTAVKRIKISGLSGSKLYNIEVLGSVNVGFNATAAYSAGAQTVKLNASYNSNKAVYLSGLQPDASGSITITVKKDTNAINSYLNAVVIQSYDATSGGIMSPDDVFAEPLFNSRAGISLVWSDRSSNETGMEVWRSGSATGTYVRVASLPANSTAYTDIALTPDTKYYYKIKAINGPVQSVFSSVATATTPSSIVLVNLTWKYPTTIMPWNNTAANPQIGDRYGDLIDDQLNNTGLGLTVVKNFNGEYSAGMVSGNNSYIFPDNVMTSNYWVDNGQIGRFKLDGLDQTKKYRIGFSGSSTWNGDMTATMAINGRTGYLNTYLNTNKVVYIDSLTPSNNGELNLDFSATGTFGFIGEIVIQAYTDSTSLPALINIADSIHDAGKDSAIRPGAKPDSNELKNLKVYPNPFVQTINVSFDKISSDKKVTVQVYSMAGDALYSKEFELPAGSDRIQLTLPGNRLSPGMYFSKISENGKSPKVVQLIKVRN